jgi:ATP-binding cassette subfamily B protein
LSIKPPIAFLERRYRGENPFRTLLYLYAQDKWLLLLAAVFYAIKSSPSWAMPLLTASVIDLISPPDQHTLSELAGRGLVIAVIVLQNIPLHYLYARLLSIANRKLEANLRSALVIRLQQLSMDFYKQHSTGALQAKLLRDVEMVQQLSQQLFDGLLGFSLAISFALIATAIRAPWFLLFFLVTVPVAALLIRTMRSPLQRRNQNFREEIEDVSARLSEMLHLIPVTRAHGLEQDEIDSVNERLMHLRDSGMRLDSGNAIFGATAWVTFRVFDLICLLTASFIVFTHLLPLSVGDVVMLTGFFSSLTNAVLALTTLFPQISKGLESIRSIGEILEYPDLEQNASKQTVQSVTGHFIFESLDFSYPGTFDSSLREISLEVQPGETIAFVGPSGAGKSTLLNLVIGFLQPNSGRILLDGHDMATLNLITYRRFLSVVPQETILFKGTIRDNILYGLHDVKEAVLQQALDDANAREFIDQLSSGLETIVGENGARLSGGQRQRIAIARALVRDPRVLLLDEATSALDNASEALIQQALERLMHGRTTFVVAHRLSTIRNATRIVVLVNGCIVEIGSHDELIAINGTYKHMHGGF